MKLIKLYKDNCNPCNMMSNYLDSLGLVTENINIMHDSIATVKYGVMSVPVLIVLNDEGNEIQRSIGFKPDELQEIADLL